jgi:death-on-curing protein
LRSEPRWLEPEDVIELNRLIVADSAEPFHVRDIGLSSSAVAKPHQHWAYEEEEDALRLARTLLFGIARNHPFEQGNKRTAFEAAIVFLELNGYELDIPDTPALAQLIVAVITHELSEREFESAIRPFLTPCASGEVDFGIPEDRPS